jgi:hypothetical protein
MAIEVGTAYLSILPSLDKLAEGIKGELKTGQKMTDAASKSMGTSLANGMKSGASEGATAIKSALKEGTKAAGSEGKAAGKEFADGVEGETKSIKDQIKDTFKKGSESAKQSGKKAGQDFSDEAEKGSKKLSGSLAAGMAAAGAAAGAALASSFSSVLGQGVASDKLAAKLGLNQQQADTAGKVAGDLYKGGFGESVQDMSDTVKSVLSNIPGLANASRDALGGIATKAATVADVFDQDVNGVTRAAGQLLKTGLAKNATEAFDIITTGFQNGADKSEDFLDTINEYSTQFRKLGIDGKQMTDIISQGLQGGARDGDLVADAFKEFSIRAVDGSKTTAAGFKAIGLDAAKMTETIAKGGPGAAKATDLVLDKLRAIKDPAKQSQAAVALFGTQAEDLGKALFSIDLSKPSIEMGKFADSTAKAGQTAYGNASSQFTSFFRGIKQGTIEAIGGQLLPALGKVTNVLGTALAPILGPVGTWFSANKPVITAFAVTLGILATGVGLVAAAQWLWNSALLASPITWVVLGIAALVAAIVYAWTNFEGFRKVVLSVWSGIQTAISFAWTKVIQPVFSALSWFFTAVLGPAVTWFAKTIVVPYFTLIGNIIKGVWDRLIYPMFQFFSWVIRNVVGPAISWLYDKIVKPVFGAIGGYFSDQWTKVIKPVLNALGGFITNTVAPAISKGVDKVKGIWDKLQGIFLTPINFLIGTVYNDGIRKVINALPGVDDVPPLGLLGASSKSGGDTRLGSAGRFATGGAVFGAGSATSDSIPAWLSNGEHVLTAKEVKAAGGHGVIQAFRQWLLKKGMGKTFDPPAFAKGGALTDDQIARAQAFARSQVGDPYVWGGVGPNGFDCSGFMSAITNEILGRNPYSRVGATGNFPWGGFEKGPGQFTIGSTKNYGGSGVGHMAGTLAGLNVESRGGQGVVVGPSARGYTDKGFNTVAHLGAAGSDGGFFATVKNVLKSLKGWVAELANMNGFGGMLKQMIQGVGDQVRGFINDKVPGPGPLNGGIFDTGGILPPGGVAVNMSSKPEAVFTNSQFADYANNRASQAGSGRYAIHIDNWEEGTGFMREIAGGEIDSSIEYRRK